MLLRILGGAVISSEIVLLAVLGFIRPMCSNARPMGWLDTVGLVALCSLLFWGFVASVFLVTLDEDAILP